MVEELDKLIGRANQFEGERNQVIHSCWFGDLETSILRVKITARSKTGLQLHNELYDPDNLLKISRNIKQLCEDLEEFIKKSENERIITLTSYEVKMPAA